MGKAARRFFCAVFGLLVTCHVHASSGAKTSETCAVDPTAIVSDACVSFSTLDELNADLQPTIQSLVRDSDFFSYYRLNLYNECPFWSDEGGLCGNIACAVNTIEDEDDIPEIWRTDELGKLEGPKARHPDRKKQLEAKPLMGELGEQVDESCVVEYDDECDDRDYCVPEDETATSKGDYVSLVDNPERFTGYSGPSAHHVWEAIYRENCFPREGVLSPASSTLSGSSPLLGAPGPQRQAAQDLRSVMREHTRHQNSLSGATDLVASEEDFSLTEDEQCLEKRVFYRIISGMHASISTHLCYDYLNQSSGEWGPNVTCYANRLHTHPDRISNLYFNYAVVLRAFSKLKSTFSSYTFCSGDPAEDILTKNKIIALADQIDAAPQIYDESIMFQDPAIAGLKEDFRNRFRNVSRTMDCVGCDKCRLWGKLQTAGYGTALKVLFEFGQGTNGEEDPPLRRTELVALLNTLDKLSHSLSAIGYFEEMIAKTEHQQSALAKASIREPQTAPAENLSVRGAAAASGISPGGVTVSAVPKSPVVQESIDEIDPDFYPPFEKDKSTSPIQAELSTLWNAVKWVVRSWLDLPSNILHVLVMELSRLWDFWLGRQSSMQPEWKIRWAPGARRTDGIRDEI